MSLRNWIQQNILCEHDFELQKIIKLVDEWDTGDAIALGWKRVYQCKKCQAIKKVRI